MIEAMVLIPAEYGSPIFQSWVESRGEAARAQGATSASPIPLADHRGRRGAAQRAMTRLLGQEVYPEDLSESAWWDVVARAEAELSPEDARDINGFGEVAREADIFLRRIHHGVSERVWQLISTGAEFDGEFTAEEIAGRLDVAVADVRTRLRALGRSRAFKENRQADVPWHSAWNGTKQVYEMAPHVRRIIRKIDQSSFPDEDA
jgi:hypothetical protein